MLLAANRHAALEASQACTSSHHTHTGKGEIPLMLARARRCLFSLTQFLDFVNQLYRPTLRKEKICRVIGPGPGNNYLVHENLHFTINANGTVTPMTRLY